LIASSSALIARCTSFLRYPRTPRFHHAEQLPVRFLRLFVIDQAVMAQAFSSSFITMNGLMHFSCWAWSLTSALEILSWM
jgi:hypothetical protein